MLHPCEGEMVVKLTNAMVRGLLLLHAASLCLPGLGVLYLWHLAIWGRAATLRHHALPRRCWTGT